MITDAKVRSTRHTNVGSFKFLPTVCDCAGISKDIYFYQIIMERGRAYIKNLIMFKRDKDLIEVLNSGWNPNSEGGWPIRLAARYGCCSIVETLIQHGANPHLVSESGASTLQLAVFSGEHWENQRWTFLLSCCDSSQLADGAAVAIIFNITAALVRIFETGRCNAHIPTTLTGKTVEQLARGFKLTHLLSPPIIRTYSPNRQSSIIDQQSAHRNDAGIVQQSSPRNGRPTRSEIRSTLSPQLPHRNLSPSVVRFFQQTASQPSLLSPRRAMEGNSSPTSTYLLN